VAEFPRLLLSQPRTSSENSSATCKLPELGIEENEIEHFK
jgi:hypothetical protein